MPGGDPAGEGAADAVAAGVATMPKLSDFPKDDHIPTAEEIRAVKRAEEDRIRPLEESAAALKKQKDALLKQKDAIEATLLEIELLDAEIDRASQRSPLTVIHCGETIMTLAEFRARQEERD